MSWLALYTVLQWMIRIGMVPVILHRRFPTATALAWLSLIFFLPELGLVVYLLIGEHRIVRRRIRKHRDVMAQLKNEDRLMGQMTYVTRPELDPAQRSVILQAERIGGMPILGGNSVEFITQKMTIQRMVEDIDAARHHVHALFYIYEPDDCGELVADALMRAVERGVRCRVLADAAGSYKLFVSSGLAWRMSQAGVEVRQALPVAPLGRRLARLDLRNHRKLLVIDGRVAYTGSQNVANPDVIAEKYGTIYDLMGRFTGPVATQLQMAFLDDWTFETGQELDTSDILPPPQRTGKIVAQAVPSGPEKDNRALPRVLLAAMNAAHRQIIISSPYFVPDEPTLLALSMAVERGVEVHMIMPERSDHPLVSAAARAYFDTLLEAGVRIHLFTKGVLHAKTMTIDDDLALLGSSNLDIRSFYLNFELNVLMYGPQITHELRTLQMSYMDDSRLLDADAWRHRPILQRMLHSAASLFSPLL